MREFKTAADFHAIAIARLIARQEQHKPNSVAKISAQPDNTCLLGLTPAGDQVFYPWYNRTAHGIFIGTTRSGKSNAMEHVSCQALLAGAGLILMDWHGSHPDSLYNRIAHFVHRTGLYKQRPVFDFNLEDAGSQVLAWNLLARPSPETEPAVIADSIIVGFERHTGRNLSQNPATKKILAALVMAAVELELTLPDLRYLLEENDPDNLRGYVVERTQDEFAYAELKALHEVSKDKKRSQEFTVLSTGTINLLADLIKTPLLRLTIGQPGESFHAGHAADEGGITLINLQSGNQASSTAMRTIATTMFSRLIDEIKARENLDQPVIIMADELPAYISRDVAIALAELGKYNCAIFGGVQSMGQLEEAGDLIADAVKNNMRTKFIFGQSSQASAEALAADVIPLDFEKPKQSMIRPTVVGQRRVWLDSHSASEHEAASESEGVADSVAESSGTAESVASASFNAEGATAGDMAGQMMSPETGWLSTPDVLSQSAGATSAASSSAGTSNSHATVTSHATTLSLTKSRTTSRMQGNSKTAGQSETFENIYEDLPTQLFSKDELIYIAARMLRTLSPGQAFVNFEDKSALVKFPLMPELNLSREALAAIRADFHARCPLSIPRLEAERRYHERRADLISRAHADRPETKAKKKAAGYKAVDSAPMPPRHEI